MEMMPEDCLEPMTWDIGDLEFFDATTFSDQDEMANPTNGPSKKRKIESDTNTMGQKGTIDPSCNNVVKQERVHLRARRGQAIKSHSLAERVRREKISERMKLLQDIVPGCNKLIGKAVMLDEIINYVQSLQRQVEFLSMKLASVNMRLTGVWQDNLHNVVLDFPHPFNSQN